MSQKVSHEAVISTLVSGASIKEAAKLHGISERTLHRWLDKPDFSSQLAQAQREISKRVIKSVILKAEKASDVLHEIMINAKVSPHARVASARTLLEFAFKAIDTVEILERVEQLEMQAENDNKG